MVDTSRDIAPALARSTASWPAARHPAGARRAQRRRSTGASTRHARSGQPALCGLDPEPDKLPESLRRPPPAEAVLAFNREIIAATSDLVVAYKPNLAFYEALGPAGLETLRQTVRLVPPACSPSATPSGGTSPTPCASTPRRCSRSTASTP